MKKIIILGLMLAALVFGGIKLVYGMTEITKLPQPKAYIISLQGQAEIKHSGAENWEKAAKNEEVKQDDTVKTGSDGTVSINFFDNSISRIGPNSDVELSGSFIDNLNYAKTKVKLKVNLGRVWSRIMQMSDKEASYEVESNNTVATVRGTTFDFIVVSGGATKISTVENVVEVALVQVEETTDKATGKKKIVSKILRTVNLPAGKLAEIKKDIDKQKELTVIPISQEELNGAWFKGNEAEDKKTEEEIKNKQAEISRQTAGILPDSGLYGLKTAAEKIRLALETDKTAKMELETAFLNQRLAAIQTLAGEGKSELAGQLIKSYETDAANILNQAKDSGNSEIEQAIKTQISNQLNLQDSLLNNVTPDQADYFLKENLKNLQENLADDADKKFLQSQSIKEKLNELKILKDQGNLELYNELMKKLDLENLQNVLGSKGLEQLNMIKGLLENIIPPIKTETEAQTGEKKPESQEAKQPEVDTTAPEKTPVVPPDITKPAINPAEIIKEIIPKIQPPVKLPETTQPKPPAEITPPPPAPLPPPPPPPIPAKVVLSKLSVAADKYNMLAGESKQFRAKAVYSDGSIKDVTNLVQWSVSGDIGTISPGGFLKSSPDGGSGIVSASYGEDGQTVSDSSPTVTALSLGM